MPRLRLACQESLAPGETFLEKAEALHRFGYEGVEVWGHGLGERLGELKAALSSSPIPVTTVCAGYRGSLLAADPAVRATARDDMFRLLDMAGELGARGLVVVPIFGKPEIPDLSPYRTAQELEEELLLATLPAVARHARAAGVHVLLEPLNRYETHFLRRLGDAASLCSRLGEGGVQILADFFHMNLEEADMAEAIRQAGRWLGHVHLADSNRLEPGKGHLDFRPGFAALKEIGYDGYLTLECGLSTSAEVALPAAARYLRGILEEVQA